MDHYKDRGRFKFKRYLFHALRNQVASGKEPSIDEAAAEATWKTRDEIKKMMEADEQFITELDRDEAWADVLEEIMWLRQFLFEMPSKTGVEIDPTNLKSARLGPVTLLEKEPQTVSGHIAEKFVEGIENGIKEEGKK